MQDNVGTEKKVSRGGRNLVLLGVISIAVALATTGVSLAVYHNSGDIYLDRSRPGFLPDEEEVEDDNTEDDEYDFAKDGELTADGLVEYLDKLKVEVEVIDTYDKPFDSKVLSDEKMGIPAGEEE